MSLQVLCMRTIINNNIDYTMLPDYYKYLIDFERHKMMFSETIYILNTINKDMEYVSDFILLSVRPVKSIQQFQEDDVYAYIWIKYVYGLSKTGSKFIQEISDIEFD